MKTICVITGTRADYGLLHWLMREIDISPEFELQTLVTGSHLNKHYGATWQEIRDAGFNISAKVPLPLEDDSALGTARCIGLATSEIANALDKLKPNLIVVLGDRFEALAAATAACVLRIPIAHFHGGETTEGAYDEAFRHSITKMSQYHFTSAEVHRHRVIQLGEHPDRVFNVGAMGLDNIAELELLNREDFEQSIGFQLKRKNILVTFHPATLDNQSPSDQLAELLTTLDSFPELGIIFTKPNSDTGNRSISMLIDSYASKYPTRISVHTSLGQLRYLSAIKHVDAVVGNSSSGLIEVPCFGIGTVNIGDRQQGRLAGKSVIHCDPCQSSIRQAIQHVLTPTFKNSIANTPNPYGTAGAARRSLEIIQTLPLHESVKKTFFDLPEEALPH